MIQFSVRRPVAILMLCLGLMVLGLLSASRIPMQLMPPMERPEFTLITEFKGAAPEEVEAQVTTPIERAIATTPGLAGMESVSQRERSEIRIRLRGSVKILDTLSILREKIDTAGLPEGAGKTRIDRAGASQEPLMRLGFVPADPEESLLLFAERLQQTWVRRAEGLDGVAVANFVGVPRRELEVEIHPAKLQSYGLSLSQIAQQIGTQARSSSAGELLDQGKRLSLRVGDSQRSIEDLRSTVIQRAGGVTLRLSDIARVRNIEQAPSSLTRLNGRPSLLLEIRKEAAANAVEVSRRLRGILSEAPEATVLLDEGSQIEAAVENVKSSVQQGAVLAAVCVFLLIQSTWPTFVVTIIIPLSLFLTWIGMHFAGISFNLMSLSGLALGVGMLVDSSMVVLESINAEGLETPDKRQAALTGTVKVFGAVAGSNLATIAVFGPLAFVSGTLGQVFRDVALTVSFCLISSLFISISVVPMLCSLDLGQSFKRRPRSSSHGEPLPPELSEFGKNPGLIQRYLLASEWIRFLARRESFRLFHALKTRFSGKASALAQVAAERLLTPTLAWVAGGLQRVESAVRFTLPRVLAEPKRLLVGTALATALGLVLLSGLGSELFPEDEAAGWVYQLDFSPGQILEATSAQVAAIEKKLVDSGEFLRVASVVGAPGAHQARLLLVPRQGQFAAAAMRLLEHLNDTPDLFYSRVPNSLLASGKPLRVEIFHENLDVLQRLTQNADAQVRSLQGLVDVENDQRARLTEVEILFRKSMLDHLDLDPNAFVSALKAALQGESAGLFYTEGRAAGVRVRAPASTVSGVETLRQFSIPNQDRRAYLQDVATVTERSSPALIRHIERKRAATVTAGLDGTDAASAGDSIRSRLGRLWAKGSSTVERPDAMEIGGQEAERRENQKALTEAIILSIFLIFLLLAAQFESLVQPLIVLLTVPLCISGVGLVLGISRVPISAQVLVGFVILVGSSVNTSIVLVDFANQLKTEGMDFQRSIIEATVKRLRPILVTTLTNILGLIPMIMATGEGAAMQKPLALTLVGGLISSTLLCLFVVPVAYCAWEKHRESRA
jgi:HAE1 family hydrophobic/amphiphilic exporter-1